MKLIVTNDDIGIVAAIRSKPRLKCVEGGREIMNQKYVKGSEYRKAVSILEQNLLAEDWYYERIVAKVKANIGDDAPSVTERLNHQYLVNLGQFFLLFSSLNMQDPAAITSYLERHNEKIKAEVDELPEKKKKERSKVIFKDTRIAKVVASCAAQNRPAFAITELAHLLSADFMAESTATRMVDDLVLAKVLVRVPDERIAAASNRELIVSKDGFLEETYAKSLLYSRLGWSQAKSSTDEDLETSTESQETPE